MARGITRMRPSQLSEYDGSGRKVQVTLLPVTRNAAMHR